MKKNEEKEPWISWFGKWFLNNKVVTGLLILLLCLLNILVFTKVSYIFHPIWQFITIVGVPIIMAGVLYYLLNPLVDWLEGHGIHRIISIILIFVLVVALLIWGIVILIPKIQAQTASFIKNWPEYWNIITVKTDEILSSPLLKDLQPQLTKMSDDFTSQIAKIAKNIPETTFKGVFNFVGAVANVAIALITTPFILFYLLKDGKKLPHYFIQFFPTKLRKPTLKILSDVNNQVASYIRGQLTVAFCVALIFMIGFSIIDLPYSVTLGIVAGFLNLIPYLGSFLAMIPAVLLGIVGGPILLLKVIVVFLIEQTVEGRVISPLVLGSQLSIHPITILFVLLTAGSLFGLVGVVLGIPGYAAIKVIITHFFEWYKIRSELYPDVTGPIVQLSSESESNQTTSNTVDQKATGSDSTNTVKDKSNTNHQQSDNISNSKEDNHQKD